MSRHRRRIQIGGCKGLTHVTKTEKLLLDIDFGEEATPPPRTVGDEKGCWDVYPNASVVPVYASGIREPTRGQISWLLPGSLDSPVEIGSDTGLLFPTAAGSCRPLANASRAGGHCANL
ncbi:hypothetical protein CB1_001241019 [Camelus ferus]|nr:hypothetical protein CB1_001241019 [Camelus ferus]